ncbi:MAG: family 20 glycosylhydrolase [Anaerolineales bacterium]|nr:family 20 glycosylhydrolase [Anaerolineales bacterium]
MHTPDLLLLPRPRKIELTRNTYKSPIQGLIVLDSCNTQAIFHLARKFQNEITERFGLRWELAAGSAVPLDQVRLALKVVPGSTIHEQGYNLTITSERIDAVAQTPGGLFYAVQTLRQLYQQCGVELPTMRIVDWPDFPHRGVLLDISRDKVPSMETIYSLVDLLASWKINQLQLYTEHTFAYRNHPTVWAEASPMTGEEILALDAYCQERFIELVPNQNTFGHMNRWLKHEGYRHLAECPDGCDTRWGRFDEPFSLSPAEPGSLELARSLLDELLPHFSSQQVNVGGDEPVDLDTAQGRSGNAIKELGVGRVYLDYILKIYREVKARQRTMQFWGDIIMEHPELTCELPHDIIALEWGYEADHPFEEHAALFAASGIPFYLCAGTSSWRTIAGRTDNALGNLRNAAISGLKNSAVGYLITDWGDEGHWQPLPVSYLGFAYGAALAWSLEANLEMDISQALNTYAFLDSNSIMGRLAYDLGNIYQKPGVIMHNSSVLFNAMQARPETLLAHLQNIGDLDELARRIQTTLEQIDTVMVPLERSYMHRPDAELVKREFAWAAEMLRHGCWRLEWAIGLARHQAGDDLRLRLSDHAGQLIAEYQAIWHARNRAGGFKDSVERIHKMRQDYSM